MTFYFSSHTKFDANSYHFCRQFFHYLKPVWLHRQFYLRFRMVPVLFLFRNERVTDGILQENWRKLILTWCDFKDAVCTRTQRAAKVSSMPGSFGTEDPNMFYLRSFSSISDIELCRTRVFFLFHNIAQWDNHLCPFLARLISVPSETFIGSSYRERFSLSRYFHNWKITWQHDLHYFFNCEDSY